jgi:hypothetical protein
MPHKDSWSAGALACGVFPGYPYEFLGAGESVGHSKDGTKINIMSIDNILYCLNILDSERDWEKESMLMAEDRRNRRRTTERR